MKIGNINEVRDHVSMLIYGEPGSGKTTLARTFGVEDGKRVAYIGVDPGQMVLAGSGYQTLGPDDGKDWNDDILREVYAHLKKNAGDYDLVFIDGIDELGEKIVSQYIKVKKDGRMAYGDMADFIAGMVKAMRDLPIKYVVFVSHIEYVQEADGRMRYHPSFPGKKVSQSLPNWFDLVACLRIIETGEGYERRLQCNPALDPQYVAKYRAKPSNAGCLDEFQPANMGVVISRILGKEDSNA